MCVDYRALNEQTVKNRYPLPRIDDLLDSLHRASYFTALDLQQAYHQVRLDPDDVPKTAFLTHKGQYEYRVLPFGLTNAPATFQALMNRVLAPLLGKCCLVYMDDILVFSKTPQEHVQHLREVLTVFRQQQLYCRLWKCRFAMQEVPFLGRVISHEGVSNNPAKVQVLLDWPEPTSQHELRCFLGLGQYFAGFISGYATLTACLQALLRKNAVWQWTEACSSAFQEVKRKLTSAPVLALPDPTKPFEVVTDACQTGIGAVLMQGGRPIAFCGRLLKPAEQRYTTTDQELLAVVYALTQWRCYLQGAQHDFMLYTDHHPNTYFATQPNLSKRQARWSEKLQDYFFKWQYRPGKHNVADPVSRSPALQDLCACLVGMDMPSFDWGGKHCNVLNGGLADALSNYPQVLMSTSELAAMWHCTVQTRGMLSREAQPTEAQPDIPVETPPAASIPTAPAVYGPHEAEHLSFLPELHKAYLQDPMFGDPTAGRLRKGLDAKNGLWYKGGVIAIPACPSIKRQILTELHDSLYAGHGGEYKTVQLVRRYFWWPSLDNDCRAFVKGCALCQRNKASTRQYAGELTQHPVASQKWEQVGMDFITHLPETQAGNSQIMVVVDTLTKLAHFVPCKMTATAEQIAALYVSSIWTHHGWPQVLITDRDPKFTDAFWRGLCTQLGIKQAMSTAHHHETVGQVERMNRILEETLRHFVNDEQDNWDLILPCAEFAVNNSYQASIGTTPFFLTYGYHPNVPLDVGLSPQKGVDAFLQTQQGALHVAGRYHAFAQQRLQADRITSAVAAAKHHLGRARNRQKKYTKAKRSHLSFAEGDQVMLQTRHLNLARWPSRKLFPLWIGPFLVLKQIGPVSYELELPRHWRIHDVFHVSLLKPYRDNGQDHPPSPFSYIAGQPFEYEVEAILDHRPHDVHIRPNLPSSDLRKLELLVRWKYSTSQHDTWEPYSNLKNAPGPLTAYGLLSTGG